MDFSWYDSKAYGTFPQMWLTLFLDRKLKDLKLEILDLKWLTSFSM